jgi:flagellar FliJ protein
MPFKFPLATVLRLREIAEQREERLLGQIHSQLAQSRLALADLEARRRQLVAQRETSLQRSTSAVEITGFYAGLHLIDEHTASCKAQLVKLEAMRDQQTRIYMSAHADKETLSEMRKQLHQQYDRELVRKEQSELDDNFSSRRSLR